MFKFDWTKNICKKLVKKGLKLLDDNEYFPN